MCQNQKLGYDFGMLDVLSVVDFSVAIMSTIAITITIMITSQVVQRDRIFVSAHSDYAKRD